MENHYYHITALENVPSILEKGLLANEDGEIFLFENKAVGYPEKGIMIYVADHIALNQVGLKEYVMLEISSDGITCKLVNDDVAEICSKHQWIARQPKILPQFIEPCGLLKAKGWHKIPKRFQYQ